MRKKKDASCKFFEVFRRPQEKKSSRVWWPRKAQGGAAISDQPKPTPVRAQPGRVVVAISREVLAISIVVLVGVIISSHVWGYRRGQRKGGVAVVGRPQGGVVESGETFAGPVSLPGTATSAENAGRPAPLAISAKTDAKGPIYTLRIISGMPLERAREITADLLAMGYDAFCYRPASARNYNVYVGRFQSLRQAEATGLKQKFAPMVYKRHRPFNTCYFVQISDLGGIEP